MKLLALLIITLITGCSSGNLDYVKHRAEEKWHKQGYDVLDYEGFQWGFWGFNSYGGAKVWYRLKKYGDSKNTYSGYLVRWGDELQVYGPEMNPGEHRIEGISIKPD